LALHIVGMKLEQEKVKSSSSNSDSNSSNSKILSIPSLFAIVMSKDNHNDKDVVKIYINRDDII
jgi:hypothetical protein